MTNRSDIPKEIERPSRKPKRKIPWKRPPRKPKAPWRDVPFNEFYDTIRSQKEYKLTPKGKKRGGKIMVGYKAGGKV